MSGCLSHTARRRPRGVTLMEVLATLVLVGIILPVAMRGVTIAMHAAANARQQSEATMLAEMKLNELIAARDPDFAGSSGDFGPDRPEYRWQVRTAGEDFKTYEVTVAVSWETRGGERSVQLSTLIYPESYSTP